MWDMRVSCSGEAVSCAGIGIQASTQAFLTYEGTVACLVRTVALHLDAENCQQYTASSLTMPGLSACEKTEAPHLVVLQPPQVLQARGEAGHGRITALLHQQYLHLAYVS